MESRTCLRSFFRYTILSILGMLGVSCYILADTFFISKGLGTNGLAALNLAIPVYNFIHGTGIMLGIGGATKFSICINQGRQNERNPIYMNTLYPAILLSAVFFLLGLFFAEPLASILGADKHILEMTVIYLRWLLLFAPAFILNDVLLCFVRNDGQPQLSMIAMLIGSFANIALDFIFIFPMQMGILGAILATGLSPVISIGVMSLHWIKRKNTFHLRHAKINAALVGQVLSLGFPSLLAQVSSGIVMITFNAILLALEGNTGVAAYGITANISLVIVSVYTGIAQGTQPLISRFYAQGDNGQVRNVWHYAILTMLLFSGILYGCIFAFAQPIAAVFNHERNARLQQMAVTGLQMYFISNPFVGYNTILAIYFTSTEKALPAQILSIFRGFLFIIPMAFLFSSAWKTAGLWLAYPAAEFLCALIGFAIYHACKKTNIT